MIDRKDHFICGFLGFLVATLLGRLDHESRSIIDVFQLQNWPALLLYGLAFYGLLVCCFAAAKPRCDNR